jgi:hypothetical protein
MLGVFSKLQGAGFESVHCHLSIDPAEYWTSYPSPKHCFDLNVRTCFLFGQFREPKIRLHYTDVWEDLLCVLGLETRVDNDILTCWKSESVRDADGCRETYRESS